MRRPHIKLFIAGKNPVKSLLQLPSRDTRLFVLDSPPVLDDLISASICSVAPMISGSGQQNKILESISLSVPVVCSRIAADPLGMDNSHVFIADSPSDFVRSIEFIVDSPSDVSTLSRSAYLYSSTKFTWSTGFLLYSYPIHLLIFNFFYGFLRCL